MSSSNAIYIVVVDVSQSPAARRYQLDYWLEYIAGALPVPCNSVAGTTLPHNAPDASPVAAISIIIVGTQSDKLSSGNEWQECRLQLKRIAEQWAGKFQSTSINSIAAAQISSTLISSVSHDGIGDLMSQIVTISQQILAQPQVALVPKAYALAEQLLDGQDARSVALCKQFALLPMQQLLASPKLCNDQTCCASPGGNDCVATRDALPATMPPTTDATRDCRIIAGFDKSMAEYLHNIGAIVISPSGKLVCLEPRLLAKLMATFVCSDVHLQHMDVMRYDQWQSRDYDDRAIMSEEQCKAAIEREVLRRENYHTISMSAKHRCYRDK
jgi:hypothetical protein